MLVTKRATRGIISADDALCLLNNTSFSFHVPRRIRESFFFSFADYVIASVFDSVYVQPARDPKKINRYIT